MSTPPAEVRPARPGDGSLIHAMIRELAEFEKLAHEVVARIARDRNCARFEWSVLDWNERAIEFYQTLGANLLPDWRLCRMDRSALTRLVPAQNHPHTHAHSINPSVLSVASVVQVHPAL